MSFSAVVLCGSSERWWWWNVDLKIGFVIVEIEFDGRLLSDRSGKAGGGGMKRIEVSRRHFFLWKFARNFSLYSLPIFLGGYDWSSDAISRFLKFPSIESFSDRAIFFELFHQNYQFFSQGWNFFCKNNFIDNFIFCNGPNYYFFINFFKKMQFFSKLMKIFNFL